MTADPLVWRCIQCKRLVPFTAAQQPPCPVCRTWSTEPVPPPVPPPPSCSCGGTDEGQPVTGTAKDGWTLWCPWCEPFTFDRAEA
jgi:hypothetical protein